MTVVCCWLDDSYGRRRVTAIADSRAATKDENDKWIPANEVTTKLYRLRVTCYPMSGLDTMNGTWVNPYYSTEIGIGFSGHCFEAMSIIALYQRCVEQLVAVGDVLTKPEPAKLIQVLIEITKRWFSGHRIPDDRDVEFLLFGFSPVDGEPWAGKVVRLNGKAPSFVEFSSPLDSQSVYSVGDVGQQKVLTDALAKIRKRIQKHAEAVRKGEGAEDRDARELEVARHSSADKKSVEQLVLDEMNKEFNPTVGGVLHKIEVIACADNRGLVTFSRNDQQHILDGLPEVGNQLGYLPMGERMGWCDALADPPFWQAI
jgi:hypothetical protein